MRQNGEVMRHGSASGPRRRSPASHGEPRGVPLGVLSPLGGDFLSSPQRIFNRNMETIAKMPGFGMASEGPLSYSFGPNLHARRTKPGAVRVRIAPIPRKVSQRLQSCRSQRSSRTIAPTRDKRVRVVAIRPIETKSSIERCTTSGISTCGVRVISWSRIRSTTVRRAASTLARTSRIWHHRAVSIPTG